ncbi:hypothetical protein F2P79_002171 [Pimephales promelas]|nr:hypothetical protein F2P79_002171 [Pimephales promelas]
MQMVQRKRSDFVGVVTVVGRSWEELESPGRIQRQERAGADGNRKCLQLTNSKTNVSRCFHCFQMRSDRLAL